MRPRRLELIGFGPFVDRAEIDFEGVDLFALTGSTGSGKTTILDAIVFALFGSVPRHKKGEVAPVVNQSSSEARVRLEFTIRDRVYTAARLVRRTKTGANTDEALLESDGEVLAKNANELTERVMGLLGLGFEQFTRCVVLPQGEFARFLHDKPAERQGLLVSLLELGLYGRVAQLAGFRHKEADGARAVIDSELERLASSTPEACELAAARVAGLDELLGEVEDRLPDASALEEKVRGATGEVDRVADLVSRLEEVEQPAGLDELLEAVAATRSELGEARLAAEEAGRRVGDLEAELSALPSLDGLRAQLEEHARLRSEREALGKAESAAIEAEKALHLANQRLEEVRSAAVVSETRLLLLRDQHAAAHLRASLRPGDRCPVCGQPMAALPSEPPPADLATAERVREGAAKALAEADQAHREAVRRQAEGLARRNEIAARVEQQSARLAEAPPQAGLEVSITEVVDVTQALDAARTQSRALVAGVKQAEVNVEKAAHGLKRARRSLQELRDRVGALHPPILELEDLATDWRALLAWKARERPLHLGQLAAARAEVDSLRNRLQEVDDDLRRRCAARGVDPGRRPVRDAVVDALISARADRSRLVGELARAEELREGRIVWVEKANVAKALSDHLRSNRFEKWVLDEAMGLLVIGANQRLSGLAGGQYSLAVDRHANFEVIDHFAAGQRRTVRSLSGGETFLVSLALALSLADHLAEMSATGQSRLESMFLDEGFGTLDAESLETVAGVVNELGAAGKTVGLVTHVRELAEQVPVQYLVTKDARTARVERIESEVAGVMP